MPAGAAERYLELARRLSHELGGPLTVLAGYLDLLRNGDLGDTGQIEDADLVIGGVLVPGAKAPKLIRREDLRRMRAGSVIVDVAVDQGGCVETIHPTTHEDPTYVVDGVIHYGVANMPGAVPRTSTLALTNATLPYAIQLADKGWRRALCENPALKQGLNVVDGTVVYTAVADAFGLPHRSADVYVRDC